MSDESHAAQARMRAHTCAAAEMRCAAADMTGSSPTANALQLRSRRPGKAAAPSIGAAMQPLAIPMI